MSRFSPARRGFTFIEQLIVIATMGRLVALLFPAAKRTIGCGESMQSRYPWVR